MHPFINIAIIAARKAGTIALNGIDNLQRLKVTEKSPNDYVTDIDKKVELDIIRSIKKAYPNHAILAEESGELLPEGTTDVTWIIDPIDGTRNYIHGFPQFAIAIAIKVKDIIEHGMVYDPFKQEFFTATKGRGAQLNDKKMRVSTCPNIKTAMVGTSFPITQDDSIKEKYMSNLTAVANACSDVRVTGSAALDLAYVACGRLDAYWASELKIWDIAASALFVAEAGGFVSNFSGDNEFLEKGQIVAGSPKVHESIMKLVRS